MQKIAGDSPKTGRMIVYLCLQTSGCEVSSWLRRLTLNRCCAHDYLLLLLLLLHFHQPTKVIVAGLPSSCLFVLNIKRYSSFVQIGGIPIFYNLIC